ncbi:hypothetical protein [Flavobacterium columnare]|nr:hypothetical protein [Flavobacterium columnare]
MKPIIITDFVEAFPLSLFEVEGSAYTTTSSQLDKGGHFHKSVP